MLNQKQPLAPRKLPTWPTEVTPEQSEQARNIVVGAMLRLRNTQPFFAALLAHMELIEFNRNTMATDGVHCYYNPHFVLWMRAHSHKGKDINGNEFVLTGRQAVEAILLHEALHKALGHHLRRGTRDPKLWNKVCDWIINGEMDEYGIHVLSCALRKPEAKGMSAEQAWAAFVPPTQPDEPDDDDDDDDDDDGAEGEPCDDGDPTDGGDDADDEGDDAPGDDASDEEGDDASDGGEGDDDGDDGDEAGQSGGSDGDEDDADDYNDGLGDDDDDDLYGEVMDHPGVDENTSADDKRTFEDRLTEELVNAQEIAEKAGNMPGNIKSLIEERLSPSQDWREVLQDLARDAQPSDFNYNRPVMKWLARGTYAPSMHVEACPPIVCFIDTSGSIYHHPEALTRFFSDIEAISADVGAPVIVACADTHVIRDEVRFYEPGEEIEGHVFGGGGTDFTDAFKFHAEELADEYEPAAIVYFTDLYGDVDPAGDPDIPVLWISYGDQRDMPFGMTLKVEV